MKSGVGTVHRQKFAQPDSSKLLALRNTASHYEKIRLLSTHLQAESLAIQYTSPDYFPPVSMLPCVIIS